MLKTLFTLLLLAAPLALAQTVYRWVDENGVVHYSDQPHPSAEKIHVKTIQTYKPQAGAVAPTATSEAPSGQESVPYKGCAIIDPAEDASYANVESVGISATTDPALQPGDLAFILVDGASPNGDRPTGLHVNLSPVDRGTHSAQLVVRDGSGNVLCQSPAVHFHVHLTSIQNPVNPAR